MRLQIIACGILLTIHLLSSIISLLTRPKMQRIKEVLQVLVSLLVTIQLHGLVKKQNLVSFSIMEAKYIVVGSSYTHLIWMKKMFSDYDIEQDTMNVTCDNMTAINISKNLFLHSQTKYIEIQHHFIRDFIEDKVISLEFIPIEH